METLDTNIQEILEIIRNPELNKEQLTKELSQYHESDIADAVPLLTEEEQKDFFGRLSIDDLAELFTYLENPEDYLEEMSVSKAADIVEAMDADDAVDILEEVDSDVVEDILEEMESESKKDIELIRQYDEDEVGSKITTNYISIPSTSSIKEAMKILVEQAPENDNISNLFVVDENNKYYGTIELKDLIIARANAKLEDITKTSYPTLHDKERVEDVISEIKDIDIDLIPVLNDDDEIIGVITSGDIIETVDEEFGEDYAKFAGLTEEEEIEESFLSSVKKRIPWLAMLLALDIVTSTVLSNFSFVIASLPSLVLFQSLVLDTSGNAGTQALAVTIRSLTNNEINKKNFWKNILKEFLTGVFNGLFAGIASFAITFLFLIITKTQVTEGGTIYTQLKASLTVSIALFSAIPMSTLAGLLFPIILKKIKIDPAVASGPLITTLSDVCGVSIYYGISILMFNLMVL